MLKDYYRILEIEPKADLESIKKAFRSQASRYHPDVNASPDARDKFEDVVEAFDVLSDGEKRKQFDEIRNRETGLVEVHPEEAVVFEAWETQSKERANKYGGIDLADLLMLEMFASTGIVEGLLDSTGDIIDSAADAMDGLFDLF